MATSQRDFELAQMAGDALSHAIKLCGKKQDKCTRFPKYLYPTYVDKILSTSSDIHELIILANETALGENRLNRQKEAAAKCVYLMALVRISFENGWISGKQCDEWQKLLKNIKYKTLNWIKSDQARI